MDEGGTFVNTYTYDAWGNITSQTGMDANPIKYAGEYLDNETGLYYLRNRYYDPTIGRFTQEDPIRDGDNWYIYCGGNPVNFIDRTGLDYIPIRTLWEGWNGKVYFDPETKVAILDTGVEFFEGDGKGTFISSLDGRMYVWHEGDDTSMFFLPGNDTVTDEGWMITTAAVTIVIGVKITPLIAKLRSSTVASIASGATLGAKHTIANISNYTVKSKHLMGAAGNWAKFATSDTSQVNTWITEALKNSNQFIVNSEDSYYTIYEMGQIIGTKGETAIKVVFSTAGKIITSFPIK